MNEINDIIKSIEHQLHNRQECIDTVLSKIFTECNSISEHLGKFNSEYNTSISTTLESIINNIKCLYQRKRETEEQMQKIKDSIDDLFQNQETNKTT